MVGAVHRRNPTAAIVLAESRDRPKELEGRRSESRRAVRPSSNGPPSFETLKLDGDKIKVINLDPAGTVPALVAGKVQAVASYAQGAVPGIEIRSKKDTTSFYYADCGVTAVSNGIIVHKDLLKQDPELIRTFVKASLRGFLYAHQHPDEAVAVTKKFAAEIVPRSPSASSKCPSSTGKPQHRGQADRDGVRRLGRDGRDAQAIRRGGATLKASDLYTDEFVPAGSEFATPPEVTRQRSPARS